MSALELKRRDYDGVLFDLDGVLTSTAQVHAKAWKETFDAYLASRSEDQQPFDIDTDYRRYVDGKPRYEGAADFLASRDIDLPRGDPDDPPDAETVCGIGNRKNERFHELLRSDGVEVLPGTETLLRSLHEAGFPMAVVSSSRNCQAVLEAAGLEDWFQARVDGVEAHRLDLPGKPAPDIFLEAARRLGVKRERVVVFEDAEAGVQAGSNGGFGFVVGIRRDGSAESLTEHGADVVVEDLSQVSVVFGPPATSPELPNALGRVREIVDDGLRLAVFLDYDGTLTPIVSQPEDAVLEPATRNAVRELADFCVVAVVSGRDLADVTRLVGVETLVYAGSHGFDIRGPEGSDLENRKGDPFLDSLDEAEDQLAGALEGIEGARIERKHYSIAVHFRNVDPGRESDVEEAVNRVLSRHEDLRKGTGKKVLELQPDLDWDKGQAVLWLLDQLNLNQPGLRVLYLGDDVTDEDAFRALWNQGVGILVRDEPRPTWARYALEDPSEVRRFLNQLAELMKGTLE